jgi:hypothetical protein
MTIPSGVFDFVPSEVEVGFPILPKGSYEIEVGEPKSFYRQGKADAKNPGTTKADNHGVMYVSKVAEGSEKGKKYVVNCYMHTPESQSFSKQFMMAVLGFKKDQEEQFNAHTANWNWRYNPQDKTCSDGWHNLKNKRCIIDVDVVIDPVTQEKSQKFIGYRPVAG